jgi:hypothetical protein
MRLSFSGSVGQQYWIVASSDLRNWEQVHFITLSIATNIEFSEVVFTNLPMRFYRVIGSGL